jgi:hypothetical protein
MRFLSKHNPELFDATRAIGFGDNPEGNDSPLTEFPGMSFVSVSPTEPVACGGAGIDGAPLWWSLHVGFEEAGTAEVVRWLCKDERVRRGEGDITELVKDAVEKARGSLKRSAI